VIPRLAGRRVDPGTAAIAALAIAWALIIHTMGWGQLASYAQVRALSDGQAEIDRWHWETKDKAWVDGHFYSVKAPGLAALTLPPYLAIEALGGREAARDVARRAEATDQPRWVHEISSAEYGFSFSRAARTQAEVAEGAPIAWALTLVGALLPAIVLLLLVRRVGDQIEPGYGAAAAITLGLGTIVMTFASEYFPHVIAATLGFAAFAILFRERRGPPRLALVGAAGLVAGLAVTFEYPLAIAGAIVFLYALSRSAPRVPRAAFYTGGAVIGALPALAFNAWVFGSPLRFAYADAVAEQGYSGHAVLGLNDGGLFGIAVPDPGALVGLLFQSRGLLTLTPILAMGVAGALLMRNRGHRTESTVILGLAGTYLLYNAAYWLPFGGGTPGPRFMIPALPYLALATAPAWKRWRALCLAVAIPSALFMTLAAVTHPLVGQGGTGIWLGQLLRGEFEHTLLTGLGVEQGWLAIAPVLIAVGFAIALAVAATPKGRLGPIGLPVAAIVGWAVLAAIGSGIADDPITLWLLLDVAVIAALILVVLRYRERRAEPVEETLLAPEPALSEGMS
jgi:4-amino-4-deoxy-L-arabinose transferase-like glycosyltransferase